MTKKNNGEFCQPQPIHNKIVRFDAESFKKFSLGFT
jgi:hypothetical protein